MQTEQSQNIATPEKIAEWKAKHGEIFSISVEDKICYLKRPDRKTLGFASQAGTTDPFKFNEVILNNCWLGGDEEIKTNDAYFLAICPHLAEVVEFKKAELVKL